MNHKYTSLALVSTLFIVYMSSVPGGSLFNNGLSKQIISNLAHIPAYALLTYLWLKAFERKEIRRHFSKVTVLNLIGLMLFAVSDEIHQSFVPGRTASFMDVSLDVIGILFGLVTFKIFRMSSVFQEK